MKADAFGRWRTATALGWLTVTLLVSAYAIVKPGTSAADLVFLPNRFASWLDLYFNFRTFLMAIGVCGVPALLWASTENRLRRRILLAIVLVILLALEVMQRWIPTRGFSWQDVIYTIGGVVASELFILGGRRFYALASRSRN
ncbi:hypothetical protein [Stieleria maiorica]|nr:hypothetical protein [Stieleria maiorica]